MERVIEYLKNKKKTISTMESATGGYLASSITNIKGSSQVFLFGAVTYSNEFKIKMGVNPDILSKYSVYSQECARSMSQNIAKFTNSDYALGITGKLNDFDPNNLYGENNLVYLSLYDKEKNIFYDKTIKVKNISRELNKEYIKESFIELFLGYIIKK